MTHILLKYKNSFYEYFGFNLNFIIKFIILNSVYLLIK